MGMDRATRKHSESPHEAESIFTKDFILTSLSKMFGSMTFTSMNASLATVFILDYGASISSAGLLVGVFVLSSLAARPIASCLSELTTNKKLAVMSAFLFFLISLVYILTMDLGKLLTLRIVHGLAFGMASNTVNVLVTNYVPKTRRGEGMGYFSAFGSLGLIIGPFLSLNLYGLFGRTALYSFFSLLAFMAFITASLVTEKNRCKQQERLSATSIMHAFRISNLIEVTAIPFSLLMGISSVCYCSFNTYLNLYAATLSLDYVVPICFTTLALSLIVSRPTFGKLYDKRGRRAVMTPSVALLALGLISLSQATTMIELFISSILVGVGYGGVAPATLTAVLERAGESRIPAANSTYYVFSDAGMGIGSSLIGILIPLAGYSNMFLIEGGATALAAFFLLAILPARNDKEK